MNINEIEKCLTTQERIDANTWFEEKGYRYATQTLFWEYPHELVFSGNVIKTQWYEDPLANDCVQAAIFTNVKGFEDYEFIILARVKNKYPRVKTRGISYAGEALCYQPPSTRVLRSAICILLLERAIWIIYP